jgi:hypothetical protein
VPTAATKRTQTPLCEAISEREFTQTHSTPMRLGRINGTVQKKECRYNKLFPKLFVIIHQQENEHYDY